MTNPDPFVLRKELPDAARPRFDLMKYTVCAVVFAVSFALFYMMCLRPSDIQVHANAAARFDFGDLHTITSQLPNPLWHVIVAALNKLGMPIYVAAALVTALSKTLAMMLTHRLLTVCYGDRLGRDWITLTSLTLMFVMAVRIPTINPNVYRGATSPNVWHNCTQNLVTVFMLLTIPYMLHLYEEFLQQKPEKGKMAMLPWSQVFWLALIMGVGLSAKPTFFEAFLPASFLFFLYQLIRQPKNWRFFGQIVLAFLPSVAYFLLQYLYYTGVVVEKTSGLDCITSLFWFREITPQVLLQCVFPLYVLIFCYRKGMLKNRMLGIALLMLAISYVEALFFHETGARAGHGNVMWGVMNSVFFLWVLMAGHFASCIAQFVRSKARRWYQWLTYSVGTLLLLWHLGSGYYYIVLLMTTSNVL